ncbi:MAG: hypothetical protein JWO67_3177 [Streptosporangiaceae bacterium]|nr:hypothetical protein [Streptosporangiaceae bacterium]
MNAKLLDLIERVSWTFIQALAGSFAAGGTAVSLQTFDWRAALVGAGTAAVLSLAKVSLSNVAVRAGQSAPVADSLDTWATELQPEHHYADDPPPAPAPAPAPAPIQAPPFVQALMDQPPTQAFSAIPPSMPPAPPAQPVELSAGSLAAAGAADAAGSVTSH